MRRPASDRPSPTGRASAPNACGPSDPKAHPAEFVAELSRIVGGEDYDVLIPGTDASLLAISRGREQVESHVKLGLPAPEIVERSLSKVALLELAAQAGIPAPETAVCTEPDAVLEAARRFGYPVMLKSGDVVFERDGELRRLGSAVVHDEPSLQRLLREYGDSWLVQRVEPGTLLSFAGVMAGGRLLAPAVSRYRRTWPPEAGSVAFSETIEPPPGLSEKVHALVAAMGWEGIFELELLEAAGRSPSTLDLNPRVYGSLALADRAGAPLPAVWCDWLLQAQARYQSRAAGIPLPVGRRGDPTLRVARQKWGCSLDSRVWLARVSGPCAPICGARIHCLSRRGWWRFCVIGASACESRAGCPAPRPR